MKSTFSTTIFLSALLFSTPLLSIAQSIVYDNTANPETAGGGRQIVYTPASRTAEFGDQITLGGTDRSLREFSFSYYYSGGASDIPTATIRFYSGDPTTSASPFFISDSITLDTRSA